MASLMQIRESQKVILWGFLVIFLLSMSIGGLVGGANLIDELFGSNLTGDAVGSVNREKISYDELNQAISQQYELARQQYGELTDRLIDQSETQAWEGLIASRLIGAQMRNRQITSSGAEIYHVLKNYPPAVLQQSEAFQTDGQFDPQLYLQALHNPQGNEWLQIENYLSGLLPGEKMNQLVTASTYATESEVRENWTNRKTKVTVDYLYVSNNAVGRGDLGITDKEIEQRYKADRDQFLRPERRLVEYAAFPKVATEADSLNVFEQASDLIERANSGESFAALAIEHSTDLGSGAEGGDLGWFERERMVAPFADAAFAANQGEIVGPVLSQFGYHVIQVRDRREKDGKEEVLASHILLDIELSPQSVNTIRNRANMFSFDAIDSSFAVASRNSGVVSQLSSALGVNDKYLPPPVGLQRAAVHFAFDAEVGDVSGVFSSDGAFVVVRLEMIIEEGYAPLEDVRSGIRRTITQERTAEQAELIMANIQSQIDQGLSWQTIADSSVEVELRTGHGATMTASFPIIGRSSRLVGVLRALSEGDVSAPFALERGQVVVKMIQKIEPDMTEYEAGKVAEYTKINNQRQAEAWGNWIQDMKNAAAVIDNRHSFF